MKKLPLNPIQYKFWLDENLKYPTTEYCDPNYTFEIIGPIVVETLHTAIQRIVDEYPLFHSTIQVTDGTPHYYIDYHSDYLSFKIESISPNITNDIIKERIRQFTSIPFDLKNEYPCRFLLMHGLTTSYFTAVFHHTVTDGFSMVTFYKRLSEIYRATLIDQYKPQPQFELLSTFNNWISEKTVQDKAVNMNYWKTYLSNTQLHTDFPSVNLNPTKNVEPFSYDFTLGNQIYEKCMNFCSTYHTRMFRLLYAVWGITLHKLTEKEDLIIDHTLNIRQKPFDNLLGVFVNNVLTRFKFNGHCNIFDILNQIHEARLGERAHALTFYHELIPELHHAQSITDNCNLNFNYPISVRSLEFSIPDCDVRFFYHYNVPTSFDIAMMIEDDQELSCHIRHHGNCADPFLHSLSESFRCLMIQILNSPYTPISELRMLSAEAEHLLIEQQNINLHQSLDGWYFLEHFKQAVHNYPTQIALTDSKCELSYSELDELSDLVALHLCSRGFNNAAIGISIPKQKDLIIGILGILKSGNHYVPIDFEHPDTRHQLILQDCNINIVLTDDTTAPLFPEYAVNVNQCYTQSDNQQSLPHILPDSTAYIIYTSGTTGIPKGIPITHSMMGQTVAHFIQLHQITSTSHVPQYVNVCFDISVLEIFPTLATGARLCLVPEPIRKDPQLLVQFLRDKQITNIMLPAPIFSLLPHVEIPSLKTIGTGGDVASAEAIKYWSKKHILFNGYGPTENTVDATWAILTPNSNHKDIGTGVPGTTCYVLDKNLRLMPDNMMGELYLGGTKLTKGYLNRPELNQHIFISNPYVADTDRMKGLNTRLYKTGDLVIRQNNGHLIFVGRRDFQVKHNGYRIELGDIESQIMHFGKEILNTIVILYEQDGISRLVAYLLIQDSENFPLVALQNYLYNNLPEYMVPKILIPMKEFPMNASHKVDRSRLPLPSSYNVPQTEFSPLQTDTEHHLAEIWSKILGMEVNNRNAHFISSGGDSMGIIMLTFRIAEAWNININASDIYAHLELAQLATFIDQLLRNTKKTVLSSTIPDTVQSSYAIPGHLFSLYLECSQSETRNSAYNLPCIFFCPEGTNKEQFLKAYQQLIARHDCFGIHFPLDSYSRPTIAFRDQRPTSVEILDIDDKELPARLNEDIRHRFNLAIDFLYYIRLYRLSSGNLVCSLIMHHLISDGWSAKILTDEFIALIQGNQLITEPKKFQTYVQELNSIASERNQTTLINYWKTYLQGIEKLSLLDRPMSAAHAAELQIEVPDTLWEQSTKFITREICTPFVYYISIYLLLLSRISRQDHFAVGYPSSGRTDIRYLHSCGYFVHPLPLCYKPEYRTLAYNEWIKHLTDNIIDSEAHPVSLIDLIDSNKQVGSLFQTMFSYEKYLPYNSWLTTHFTPFSLSLTILEHEHRPPVCKWEYCTDVFSEEEIQIFAQSFFNLQESLLQHPERPLHQHTIASCDFINQIIAENTLAKVYRPSIPTPLEVIHQSVMLHPDVEAVVCDNISYSYTQLWDISKQVVNDLHQSGIPSGCRIGLSMRPSALRIAVIIGILRNGCSYVPIDSDWPDTRRTFVLADAMCCVSIQDSDETPAYSIKKIQSIPHYGNTDEAYVIYTSGTTGRPKGIPISHTSLAYLIEAERDLFKLTPNSRVLQFASIGFDASVTEIFTTLAAGSTLVVAPEECRKDPLKLSSLLIHQQITCATIPPVLLSVVPQGQYPSLTTLIVGGESTPKSVIDSWMQDNRCIINAYGPTENTVDATMNLINNYFQKDNIGKPLPAVSCYIMDSEGQIMPTGITGELYIGGLQLTSGYLGAEELNQLSFIANPFQSETDRALGINNILYKSGDLVCRQADGSFVFKGRTDSQIKWHGFRIELNEIAHFLEQHPSVGKAYVCITHHESQPQLTAYIQVNTDISIQQIAERLKTILPTYMIPSRWAIVNEFSTTVNGKIDESQLPAPTPYSRSGQGIPTNSDEKRLTEIAKRILGTDEVGTDDDLLDLGMTSMQIMEFVANASEHDYSQITISAVYTHRTIRTLLKHSDRLLHYWAEGFDSGLPLMIVVSGYSPFSPFYDTFFKVFHKRYSIFVFESFNEYFLHKPEISLDHLINHYCEIIHSELRGRTISVITGFCMGSELGVALANRLQVRYPQASQPCIMNLEGVYHRHQSDNEQWGDTDLIQEYSRITTTLNRQQPPMDYTGRIIHFLAQHPTAQLYYEETEAATLTPGESIIRQHSENIQALKQHYPNSPLYLIDCTHWTLLQEDHLHFIMDKTTAYLLDK